MIDKRVEKRRRVGSKAWQTYRAPIGTPDPLPNTETMRAALQRNLCIDSAGTKVRHELQPMNARLTAGMKAGLMHPSRQTTLNYYLILGRWSIDLQ